MKSTLLLLLALLCQPVVAGESVRHSGASARHSAEAVGHGAMASTALVSGAVAVPLALVGTVGDASGAAADAAWRLADGTPLAIGDEVVTAGPDPAEALAATATRR